MYVNAPRYLLRKYCVLKLIKDLPTGKILDIGCGAGDLCETMFRRGFDVKGIDFSDEAIELCKQRVPIDEAQGRMRFEKQGMYDIHETFDIVFLFEVLEHIEDDQSVLRKIYDLLTPKGYLILSVPAHQKWFGPSDRYVGHYRRYDRSVIVDLLKQNGFDILKLWSYGVPLANVTAIIHHQVYGKNIPKTKEEGSKKSGVKRDFEAKFRFFLNDFFMCPFYLLQVPFFYSNLGTGFIIKAQKR